SCRLPDRIAGAAVCAAVADAAPAVTAAALVVFRKSRRSMSSLRNDAASARRIVTYHVCDTLSPTWSDTMPKNAYITARVDKSLKAKAEKVLGRVGITTTDAITMLLHQIVLRKGLPFEARIP